MLVEVPNPDKTHMVQINGPVKVEHMHMMHMMHMMHVICTVPMMGSAAQQRGCRVSAIFNRATDAEHINLSSPHVQLIWAADSGVYGVSDWTIEATDALLGLTAHRHKEGSLNPFNQGSSNCYLSAVRKLIQAQATRR
jgi:hypothetical protein